MSICGVVRRRYGLGVRRGAIVEVDLGPGLVIGLGHQLLRLLDALRPSANHPHEQRDNDEEHDGGRYATGNVREVRLVLAVGPDERADATARWLTAQVLDARALVLAVAVAHVFAHLTGSVESRTAFALEVGSLWYQQTVGINVAVLARHVRLTRVPAFGFARLRQT